MKIKRVLWTILLLGMILSLVGCNRASNDGFYLYKSSPLGFSMEYPMTWTKEIDAQNHIAAFVTPTEGFGDTYRDNVTVSYQEPEQENFDTFFDLYYSSLPATFPGFTEVSREDVFVDDKEAVKIVFTSSSTEKDEESGETTQISLKILQYAVKNGDRVYFITYIATPNAYDYFEPFVNTMIQTLKIY